MTQEGIQWFGRLEQVTFLERLYKLDELPSNDYRYKNSRGDITQHTVNNDDWDIDWVFTDDRFKLLDGSDELFLNFIEQCAAPGVRANAEEEVRAITAYNKLLASTPYLFQADQPFGDRHVYKWTHRTRSLLDLAGTTSEQLTQQPVLAEHIKRMTADIEVNPDRAIGTAKNLLESLSRQILSSFGIPYLNTENIQQLYKRAFQAVVSATPEGTLSNSEEEVGKLFGQLSGIVSSIRNLRNAIGDGHGRETVSSATAVEARLVTNSSITACTVLSDLFHMKSDVARAESLKPNNNHG